MCVCVCVYLFIWIGKKQRDYAFIPTSLFRDYSLIRGFFVKNIHDHFMSWRMLALRSPYNSAIIRYNPCLKEKLFHHSINVMNSCPHAGTETKRYCVQLYKALKFTATPIMQICKVYKRWLRIFLTIKSPDE